MKKWVLFFYFFIAGNAFAQNRNSVWCFGDSALIDFSDTANLVIGSCGLDTRGSCVSISNESGQLLFYAETRATIAGNTTLVFDTSHQIMQNGDSIIGEGWYHELIIIPFPDFDSLFYLFSIGITGTSQLGLYWSKIDMSVNGNLGAVVQKNVQLQNFEQVDCLTAIKHGNGRDWWIIFRKSEFFTGGSNNDWYSYLITPDSIHNFSVQSIGSQNRTNIGQICFSPMGNKLAFINLTGVTELFDFDRCTGLLSNPITIEVDPGTPPYPFTWSCAFSRDASRLYVTTNDTLSFLYQYDLNAPNITASKDTLWSTNYPKYAIGGLKLAPDNKIYLSSIYYNGFQFPYPYPDSVYNMYNMNLSVINQPDSLGAACNFQPYSFYLGGKRTYVGLPNNPDYELGTLTGSACDTLTVGSEESGVRSKEELFVFYHADWEKAFINAKNIKGKNYSLKIYSSQGRLIYSEEGKAQPPYFTKDVSLQTLAAGIYIVNFQTEKEILIKKFVKN